MAEQYVPDERDFIDSWACAHVTAPTWWKEH